MVRANCPDDHVTLLQCIFGTEQNVFGFPEFLRSDKVDPVFRLIRFALLRIEFEVNKDLRNGLTTWKRLFVHAVVKPLEAVFAQGFRLRSTPARQDERAKEPRIRANSGVSCALCR